MKALNVLLILFLTEMDVVVGDDGVEDTSANGSNLPVDDLLKEISKAFKQHINRTFFEGESVNNGTGLGPADSKRRLEVHYVKNATKVSAFDPASKSTSNLENSDTTRYNYEMDFVLTNASIH